MIRSSLRGGLVALALLGASACEEDARYSYVSVKVELDETADEAFIARIRTCGVNVTGDASDFHALACRQDRDLGTIDWSTLATGRVRFLVNIRDLTEDIGSGESDWVNIVPGGTAEARVVVKPKPMPAMP